MTIKQQGGVFGRNPSFNDVEVQSLTIAGNAVPDASTILVDSDIGASVQGYDAATAKLDVTQTFNQPQTFLGNAASLNVQWAVDGGSQGIAFKNSAGTTLWDISGGVQLRQDELAFRHQGSTVLYLDNSSNVMVSSGNLVIGTSGKGIDFSATSGTGTSELFDDYEEGTWTPTLTGSTGAPTIGYQTQDGFYTKAGRLVTAQIYLQFNTVSGGSGNIQISLPFAAANTNQGAANVFGYNITHPNTYISGFVNPNTATLTPFGSGSNATWAANTIADLKVSAVQAYAITAQYYVA